MKKVYLFLTMMLVTGYCNANSKKYQISVCSFFKNESMYLQEWIEYHRMIGVDHFYLYNNNSDDTSLQVLNPYVKMGVVTIVRWPSLIPEYLCENLTHFALSTLVSAYENAAKYKAYLETEWLCFLGVDEFIVPMNSDNLKKIIKDNEDCGAIEFSLVECFRACNVSEGIASRFVTESCVRVEENTPIEIDISKMLFKPECYTYFKWPPYQCQFKEGTKIKNGKLSGIQVNKYTQRMKGKWKFFPRKKRLNCKSCSIPESELKSWLQNGYEIEDHEHRILHFVPDLKKRIMH